MNITRDYLQYCQTDPQREAVLTMLRLDCNSEAAAQELGISRSSLRSRLSHVIARKDVETGPLERAQIARSAKIEQREERKALDLALAKLERAERTIDVMTQLAAVTLPDVLPIAVDPKRRTAAAVALLSDIHYGAVFPETASTFGNAVNPAIITNRLRRFFEGVVWLVKEHRSWATLDTLVLAIMGDTVEGQLHEETTETAQPVMRSILEVQPLLLSGIMMLKAELDPIEIVIPFSWGNHGRDTRKIRWITGAEHSADWLIGSQLAPMLPDGCRIHVDRALDQYINVLGHRLHFQHGLSIGYQGGVGGLSIPLNKAVATWDERDPCDLHHIGHWHQLLYGRRWFVNGSIKGYDPYVSSKNARPERPQQWFYVLDEAHGATCMTPIWVESKKEELALR